MSMRRGPDPLSRRAAVQAGLAVAIAVALIACGGGGGRGKSSIQAAPANPPSPTGQAYDVRWLPSTSPGVVSYELSLGASSGSYDANRTATIPVAQARAGSGGSLVYTIQLDRSRDQYLAMRAFDSNLFSAFSNELRVAALPGSPAAPSAVSAPAAASALPSASSASASTSVASASVAPSFSAESRASSRQAPQEAATVASAAALTSLDLNGEDEYLGTTRPAALDFSGGLSASLWGKVALDALPPRALLQLSRADAASPSALELYLVRGANGPAIALRILDAASSSEQVGETPVPIESDVWWHLALVLSPDATSARVYFDGELATQQTELRLPPDLLGAELLITLGAADAERAAPWRGRLGHAALFQGVLGGEEIAEISLRGHALDLRSALGQYHGASALTHYWRLGATDDAVIRDSGPLPLDFDDPYGNIDRADVASDGPESLATAESGQ